MSDSPAYVLIASRPTAREGEIEGFAYGTRQAVLPLRITYFGGAVEVWQMKSWGDATSQADRLASGWFTAIPLRTLGEVQGVSQRWAREGAL